MHSQKHFVDKNNDALHESLAALLESSNSPLIQLLFAGDLASSASMSKKGGKQGKLNFVSVGSKFRTQLNELLEKLKTTVNLEL